MIRINLLPQAKGASKAAAQSAGSNQSWVIGYFVGGVLWCIGLAVIYFVVDGELAEQRRKNAALKTEIAELEKKSAGLDEVKAKLLQSKQLEEVVAELNKARTGPTRVLVELSKILSKAGGPSIDPEALERLRRDNPLAGYNRSWDVRRLWLTSFEEDGRQCRISGMGKTNEDVAEFLQRLALSVLFDEVTLEKTQAVTDSATKLALIGFDLTCRVEY